jgi:hypothetical protein
VPVKPKLFTMVPIGMGQGMKTYDESCIMSSEDEMTRAYTHGEVPAWIQHYANTGKLVTDEEAKAIDKGGASKKEGKAFVDRLLNK